MRYFFYLCIFLSLSFSGLEHLLQSKNLASHPQYAFVEASEKTKDLAVEPFDLDFDLYGLLTEPPHIYAPTSCPAQSLPSCIASAHAIRYNTIRAPPQYLSAHS